MFRRNCEPVIYIGPAPRRRRGKVLALGLIVALVAALVMLPGRPRIVWQPTCAQAEHVTCTVTNWWGNWVSLAKVWAAIREVYSSVVALRDLISQKWNEFMRYRRQVDYALSVIRNPEEALRDYLLREGKTTLSDLFREEEARLKRRVDVTSAQLGAALGLDSGRFRHEDWMDFAVEAKQHARAMAKVILRRAQAPEPVRNGGRRAVRRNEQAIQLQLPAPPSKQEVAEALRAANPASGGEAAQKVARAVAARKWASARMREAVLDLTVSDRKLRKWLKELPQIYQEIDRHPYTSGIKTLTKVTIQNQIILLRILRQVSAQNLAFQASYAQSQAERARKAIREASLEAIK